MRACINIYISDVTFSVKKKETVPYSTHVMWCKFPHHMRQCLKRIGILIKTGIALWVSDTMMRVNNSTQNFVKRLIMFTPGHIYTYILNEDSIQSASFKKCFAVLEAHGNSLFKYLNSRQTQKAFRSYFFLQIYFGNGEW